MSHCGIIPCLDAQLLLRVYLEGGSDVAGGHGHHKLHVAFRSCSAPQADSIHDCMTTCA